MGNSAKCKMKFMGHWLRNSTTQNVTTLFTESSQAMHFAFMFVAANLNWLLLSFNSDSRKVFTSIYKSLYLKMRQNIFSTKMCRFGIPDPI